VNEEFQSELAELRDARASNPECFAELAAARSRGTLARTGRTFLIAADHTARNVIGAGGDPTAMADREELLRRVIVALQQPGVDGVLGTADILEDLLFLGALGDKVAVASMNRGGIAGASFEIDDRFTACDAATIAAMRWDAGKVLCRIDPSDAGSARTLEACANAVRDLAALQLPIIVEAFMSRHTDGRLTNDLSVKAITRSAAIASGLGPTSAYTWLKLPVIDNMEQVARATTLPVLLLGGDPTGGEWDATFAKWGAAVALPGMRGLVAGRSLLYPPDGDVAAAVRKAAEIVHESVPA
jgi:hypothetical protein